MKFSDSVVLLKKVFDAYRNQKLNYLFAVLLASLVACAPPVERHSILGTTYGWEKDAYDVKILLDAKIDKLQVRHVRLNDPTCIGGFADHMEISGEVGPDSTAAVARLIPQLKVCEYINPSDSDSAFKYRSNAAFLSSGGGLLKDGYALGNLFRENNISTIITGGQKCASSCAIAFLGGIHRKMEHDAQILFHAPYLTNGISIDCQDTGQVVGLQNYYKSMLGEKDGEFLLQRTMSYCSVSSGWTLNADGAKLFGITTH